MSFHRYHPGDLRADLVRAAAGLALCAAPPLVGDFGIAGVLVFALPGALFAAFGIRTWLNRSLVVALAPDGIEVRGWIPAAIAWRELRAVKLSYFSTRRDREAGWMHLTLKGGRRRISLHSSLIGFRDVCGVAFVEAHAHDIRLSEASARNFASLGFGDAPTRDPRPASLTGWGNPADWRR